MEGIKSKKLKLTYEADYKETQIENYLLKGIVRIPRDNVVVLPNEIFNKKI